MFLAPWPARRRDWSPLKVTSKRPAHRRGDLAGDTHRQGANVLMLDRRSEQPFLPEHRELLARFLGAAISLDPIWRCHVCSSGFEVRLGPFNSEVQRGRVLALKKTSRGVRELDVVTPSTPMITIIGPCDTRYDKRAINFLAGNLPRCDHQGRTRAFREMGVAFGAALVLLAIAVLATRFAFNKRDEADANAESADMALALARENESRALAALSDVARREGSFVDSIKLALASLPRIPADARPNLPVALDAVASSLSTFVPILREYKHETSVGGALLTRDERRVLSWDDNSVRLWDVATGRQIGPSIIHETSVGGALLTRDERRILSRDGNSVRLWDVATERQIGPAMMHEATVLGALLNRDESQILSWSLDGSIRLWDAATGQQVRQAMMHKSKVLFLARCLAVTKPAFSRGPTRACGCGTWRRADRSARP
jgi:hypothetical protein